MRDTYRPRRILAVLAAIALPAVTCGVAPALQDLVRRMERVEAFLGNAQLPAVLVDEHNIVVGTVLEYNDMYQYASVGIRENWGPRHYAPWLPPEGFALATIQVSLPGRASLMLEANREEMLTPKNGNGTSFYFESADCTGIPWTGATRVHSLPGDGNTLFSRGWIGPPGKTLYAVSPGTPARSLRWTSQLIAVGVVGETQRCLDWGSDGDVLIDDLVPLEPVADLTVYTPPFRIVHQHELWGW